MKELLCNHKYNIYNIYKQYLQTLQSLSRIHCNQKKNCIQNNLNTYNISYKAPNTLRHLSVTYMCDKCYTHLATENILQQALSAAASHVYIEIRVSMSKPRFTGLAKACRPSQFIN